MLAVCTGQIPAAAWPEQLQQVCLRHLPERGRAERLPKLRCWTIPALSRRVGLLKMQHWHLPGLRESINMQNMQHKLCSWLRAAGLRRKRCRCLREVQRWHVQIFPRNARLLAVHNRRICWDPRRFNLHDVCVGSIPRRAWRIRMQSLRLPLRTRATAHWLFRGSCWCLRRLCRWKAQSRGGLAIM